MRQTKNNDNILQHEQKISLNSIPFLTAPYLDCQAHSSAIFITLSIYKTDFQANHFESYLRLKLVYFFCDTLYVVRYPRTSQANSMGSIHGSKLK